MIEPQFNQFLKQCFPGLTEASNPDKFKALKGAFFAGCLVTFHEIHHCADAQDEVASVKKLQAVLQEIKTVGKTLGPQNVARN